MINRFTSFRNWDNSLIYEAVNGSNQTHSISLQWVYDSEWPLRPRTTIYTLVGKRCVDIFVSLFVVLFVLSWMVPIVALFIYFDSPGPFYFFQRRTGVKGKPFSCLKFRTMVYESVGTEFQQTLKYDCRVTRVGQFLRRTNLDEMLQFINVLIGDMTLVGPRPHAVAHDARHWASDAYRARYLVKPGITGLAQIRGARGATIHPQSMNHRVRYDHLYIRNQTFILDVRIFIATVLNTLQGDTNAW